MSRSSAYRKLWIYLAATWLISWTSWWVLVLLVRQAAWRSPSLPFVTLYALGGLGPTIAAYIAVLNTASLTEFNAHLFRWRLGIGWYLAGFGLPVLTSLLALAMSHFESIAAVLSNLSMWYRFAEFFPVMVLGGGLEELGWRGVALPELQRRFVPFRAAVIVGIVWAVWHVPLFFLPGVSQYGAHFLPFALQTMGLALVLGWLYNHTGSILLCIILHAASNSAAIAIPNGKATFVSAGAALWIVAGVLLFVVAPARGEMRQAASR